jgi:hypothetical protein
MKLTIVTNNGDWEALYKDGKKVYENHRISKDDILDALGIEVENVDVPEEGDVDYDENVNYFPDTLKG